MLVDPNKYPSFCKLLFRQGFMDKILMPTGFIKKHKNMLAKTCLLKSNTVGIMSWGANIVREKSNYFICEGEWTQFVMHHQLELGDILLFFLIDKSTFQVFAYNRKSYSNFIGNSLFEELSSSSEEKQDTGRKSNKRVKTEPKESSGIVAHEEEEAKSGSEENGPKKIRFSVVNFNNKDPYYEMVIKKSHSVFMSIPISFARWTGISNMKRIRLVNEKGKEWRVDIVRKPGSIRITRGWAEFRTHNKIAKGETCRFKLIQGNGGGNNVLQVQKIFKPRSLH